MKELTQKYDPIDIAIRNAVKGATVVQFTTDRLLESNESIQPLFQHSIISQIRKKLLHMAHAEKKPFRETLRNTVENGAIVAGVLGIIGILSLSTVAVGALIGVPIFEKWSRRKPGGGGGHH